MTEKLSVLAQKMNQNLYIRAISEAMMSMIPLLIIGAFASLFAGLPINAYQEMIANTGIISIFQTVVNVTTNMIGLYTAYFVGSKLAVHFEQDGFFAGMLSVASFMVCTPVALIEGETSAFPMTWLGSAGMFSAFIISIISVKLYKFIIDKDLTLKLPEGTPEYVGKSFTAILPGAIVVLMFSLINYLLQTFTSFDCVHSIIYNVIQTPLMVFAGGNIVSLVVLTIVAQALWFFGIHGGNVTNPLLIPALISLDTAQVAAYAAGQELPNHFGLAFYFIYVCAANALCCAIVLTFFCKSQQYKTLGKIALPATVFEIGEPIAFGLPVVFNLTMLIPWILVPVISIVLPYIGQVTGLVPAPCGVAVYGVPMIISGILNGSVRIAIMQVVVVVVGCLVWYAFLRVADRKNLEMEKQNNAGVETE